MSKRIKVIVNPSCVRAGSRCALHILTHLTVQTMVATLDNKVGDMRGSMIGSEMQ